MHLRTSAATYAWAGAESEEHALAAVQLPEVNAQVGPERVDQVSCSKTQHAAQALPYASPEAQLLLD